MPYFSYIVDHDGTFTKYVNRNDSSVNQLTQSNLQKNTLAFYHPDLVATIKANPGVIYPGSMRSSALQDAVSSNVLVSATFYHTLEKLSEETQTPLIHFLPGDWGLVDYKKPNHPIQNGEAIDIGSSWEEMRIFYNAQQWHEKNGWLNTQQLKNRSYSDHDKIILIYAALAHHAVAHISDSAYTHTSKFVDDNRGILQALYDFYSVHTDMIYKNTQLQLCLYNPADLTMREGGKAKAKVMFIIQGTGEYPHLNFLSICRILYSKCINIQQETYNKRCIDRLHFSKKKKELIHFAQKEPWTTLTLSAHLQQNSGTEAVSKIIFEIDALDAKEEKERFLQLLTTVSPDRVETLQDVQPKVKKAKTDNSDDVFENFMIQYIDPILRNISLDKFAFDMAAALLKYELNIIFGNFSNQQKCDSICEAILHILKYPKISENHRNVVLNGMLVILTESLCYIEKAFQRQMYNRLQDVSYPKSVQSFAKTKLQKLTLSGDNNAAANTLLAWQAMSSGLSSEGQFRFQQAFWGKQYEPQIAALLASGKYESKEIDTKNSMDAQLLSGTPDYADPVKFGQRDIYKHRLWIFKNLKELEAPNLMQLIIFCHYSGDYLYIPDTNGQSYMKALDLDSDTTALLYGDDEYAVRLLRRAQELFGDKDRNSRRYAKVHYDRRLEQNKSNSNNINIERFAFYNHSISIIFAEQLMLLYPCVEVVDRKITEKSLGQLGHKNLDELYLDLLFYQKLNEIERGDIKLAEENYCCQFSTYQVETAEHQQGLAQAKNIVAGDDMSLYLDGKAGIGKTHLIIAAAKGLLEKDKDAVIAFLTPEKLRKQHNLVDVFIHNNPNKKIIWMLDDCNSNADALAKAFEQIVKLSVAHNNNNGAGSHKGNVLLVTSNLPYHEFVKGVPGLQATADALFESKKQSCTKVSRQF